jgi:hypothetical protein
MPIILFNYTMAIVINYYITVIIMKGTLKYGYTSAC